MSFFDRMMARLDEFVFWAITGLISALAGAVWWFVRIVFTNQAEIKLMTQHLQNRDEQRKEDRERLSSIETSIRDVQVFLMGDHDHDQKD